ncbi:hypothetical protein PF049_10735 [Erythrobacteraceae bacterium WH01K]|nr:hypothetical protein PF049_10735 [Erythrobacteraceae bacterium WH01K]
MNATLETALAIAAIFGFVAPIALLGRYLEKARPIAAACYFAIVGISAYYSLLFLIVGIVLVPVAIVAFSFGRRLRENATQKAVG